MLKAARKSAAEITEAARPKPAPAPSAKVGPPREELEASKPQRGAGDRSIEQVAAVMHRRHVAAVRQAEAEMARAAAQERWSHKWEGTPETHEKFSAAPDRISRFGHSAIHRMHALGKITAEELAAAEEIACVVEMIERDVSMGTGSFAILSEMLVRVDCSGSARDQLVESLGRIRLELAYRAWRECVPQPKRMIIDMVTSTVPYVRLAAGYGLHWRTARKRLITALRLWPQFKDLARAQVGREDVGAAYERLGEGTLLAPRPKPQPPTLSEDEAA